MKKIAFISLFLCYSLASSAQGSKDIRWISFEQLSDSLKVNPKKVLLFFHTDWCAFCKKMERETFKNKHVIEKINSEYYAVNMDAETVDTLYFEQIAYTNKTNIKKTNQYHKLAELFFTSKQKPVFPLTVILSQEFIPVHRENNYLSIKQLLKIL